MKTYAACFALLLAVFLANLMFGAANMSVMEVSGALAGLWRPFAETSDLTANEIILRLRCHRIIAAFLAGALLALSGAILQRLLRNPLADPFILGITSGGSLGASLVTLFGSSLLFTGVSVRILAAFVGCLLTLGALLAIRRRMRSVADEYTIPVIGVVLNSFLGSALMLTVTLADERKVGEVMRWMLGSLQSLNFEAILVIGIVGILLAFFLLRLAPAMHALQFDDSMARSLGFDAEKLRRRNLVLVALMISCVVSITGSLGFVGLIVPHFARKIARGRIKREWLLSMQIGAIVLGIADGLGRTILPPLELPAGLFTALIGAPALAFILMRRAHYAEHS